MSDADPDPEPCLRGDGTRCAYADGEGNNCGMTCALRHPAPLAAAMESSIDAEHRCRRTETAGG